MFDFEGNRTHSRILLALTLFVIIGYAWIGSWVLKPRFSLPTRLVSDASMVEKHEAFEISEISKRFPFFAGRLVGELTTLDSTIGLIGGFGSPVELEINVDEPWVYRISESRIELGVRVLESRGQVGKAFLKSWLLKRARPEVQSSLLRQEVASDLLWAFLRGDGELEALGTHRKLRFAEPKPWLIEATSLRAHCRSPWNSQELRLLCRGVENAGEAVGWASEISPLGFRSLLGSLVWKRFNELTLGERVDFIGRFARTLTAKDARGAADFSEVPQSASLIEWQSWLRSEYRVLAGAERSEAILELAQLKVDSPLSLAVAFHVPKAGAKELEAFTEIFSLGHQRAWRKPFAALVNTGAGVRLLPGGARIAATDQSLVRADWMVWESCESPDVSALENAPVRTQRMLVVRACDQPLSANYLSLVALGVESFAKANPELAFVQLKTSALRLAARKGLLTNERLLEGLLLGGGEAFSAASTDLGLRSAEWKRDAKAFRVLGAIEAFEWYRGSSPGAAEFVEIPGAEPGSRHN